MLYDARDRSLFSRIDLAFVTEDGVYEWNFSPMGFANSGQDFQAEIEDVLRDCAEFIKVFQDDIIIMSDNIEDHYRHIKEVLSRLHNAFIIPNLSKCEWFKSEIKFCGFIISKNLIKPDMDRVKVIKEIAPPKTVHAMQKFLGMINYFNSFIPNYSTITAKLYEELKNSPKNRSIKWSDELLTTFNKAKGALARITSLLMPNYDKTFHIFTDASELGMGCCLGQYINNKFHPIAFAGTKFNDTQKKYSIPKKELLGILTAIKKFDDITLKCKTVVHTDHKAWSQNVRDKSAVINRWMDQITENNIIINTSKENIT